MYPATPECRPYSIYPINAWVLNLIVLVLLEYALGYLRVYPTELTLRMTSGVNLIVLAILG